MEKLDIYANKKKLDWWVRRITDPDFPDATKKEILDFFDKCTGAASSV